MSCNVIVGHRVDDNGSGGIQEGRVLGVRTPTLHKEGKKRSMCTVTTRFRTQFPKPPFPRSSICPYKVEDDNTFTYARS